MKFAKILLNSWHALNSAQNFYPGHLPFGKELVWNIPLENDLLMHLELKFRFQITSNTK